MGVSCTAVLRLSPALLDFAQDTAEMQKAELPLGFLCVDRDGIEPPTHGFSVPARAQFLVNSNRFAHNLHLQMPLVLAGELSDGPYEKLCKESKASRI